MRKEREFWLPCISEGGSSFRYVYFKKNHASCFPQIGSDWDVKMVLFSTAVSVLDTFLLLVGGFASNKYKINPVHIYSMMHLFLI